MGREHTVPVHVPDALVDVVGARPHLGVATRIHPHSSLGQLTTALSPMFPVRSPWNGRADAVDLNDRRGLVAPTGGHVAAEHVRRFDDVVIDAHEDLSSICIGNPRYYMCGMRVSRNENLLITPVPWRAQGLGGECLSRRVGHPRRALLRRASAPG